MDWFNYIGLIIIVVIMIPNIVFAIRNKDSFNNVYKNKILEISEQLGRYGCLFFMVFNVPCTYFNFWFINAKFTYIIVNSLLSLTYLVCWAIFWKKNNLARALWLSILPSCIFIFSGVMLLNVPLIVFSLIFATSHILISVKNELLINFKEFS